MDAVQGCMERDVIYSLGNILCRLLSCSCDDVLLYCCEVWAGRVVTKRSSFSTLLSRRRVKIDGFGSAYFITSYLSTWVEEMSK